MTDIERILDEQLTDAVTDGRTTPEAAEWWETLPYGEKATQWWERQQEKWRGSNGSEG